jgi:CheY-like chemotaxis protein
MAAEGRPVVLVIDDHAEYLEALEFCLREEFDVLTATSGLDGYALACERRPDAIVVDVMMPVVDGWTLLRKLKVNPAFARTPIIVASAVSRAKVLSEVDPWQVAAVIQKPCDAGQVGNAIRSAIAARRASPAPDGPLARES